MYKFLSKNGQLLGFLFGVVVVAIFLLVAIPNAPEVEGDYTTGAFDAGLYMAMGLILLAAFLILAFGLVYTISNFRSSIKGIIGIAIIVVIFLIAYYTAGGEITAIVQGAIDKVADNGGEITARNLKFIDGALTTSLIILVLAGVITVVGEILNLFK